MNILKKPYFWLGLILILGFIVRLYKIDAPIADWHSWRQVDTAAVTRNFVKLGFNPFYPLFDDMSSVAEKAVPNPEGIRFVEFPIYNMLVYPFYVLFGIDEKYHRLVSILAFLGSSIFLYFIVKKYTNSLTAFISTFTFTFLPFNIFFSRTTLPEPTFIFFALGMVYFVGEWISQEKVKWVVLGFLFTAIAFLIKPWAIFFFLPLIYLVYLRNDKGFFLKKFIPFTFFSLLPFILWRFWILQFPEGIPASNWLVNSDGIRFKPIFFWWILSERLGREILGAAGLALFFIGLIFKTSKNYFLHIWALSMFLYLIIFATGNVRHNYYQLSVVPVASIFLSLGFIQLIKSNNLFVPRIWTIIIALLLFPLSFYFGFNITKEFYKINNPGIVEVGKRVDVLLPKDAIVLAPYNGDTAFLYQTNRVGWAFIPTSISNLITDYGVNYYVSVNYDDKTNWVLRHFYIIEQTPQYIIADLKTVVKELDNSVDPEPR